MCVYILCNGGYPDSQIQILGIRHLCGLGGGGAGKTISCQILLILKCFHLPFLLKIYICSRKKATLKQL